MKKFLFTITATGMIYAKVHIFHQLVKLVKLLNLQKYPELTGEVTIAMKCCREYMVHVGEIIKS